MIVYLPGFTGFAFKQAQSDIGDCRCCFPEFIQCQAAVWLALSFIVGFDCIAVSDNDDKDRVDPVVFLC